MAETDPLKVLSIAATKIKIFPFSFLDILAELACQNSPMKITGRASDDANTDDRPGNTSRARPRAYSESWVGNSTWASMSARSGLLKRDSDVSPMLPQMYDKYSSIYNKNGRIGIYTKEERNAIITRFREKKRRRVWKKKIRYHCRKNLADRRVRVKGRFVRAGGGASSAAVGCIDLDDEDGEEEEDEEEEEELLPGTGAPGSEAKRVRDPDARLEKHVAFKQESVGLTESSVIEGIGHDRSDDVDDEGHFARRKKMRRHSIAY